MTWDTDTAAFATRLTARISAGVFGTYLVALAGVTLFSGSVGTWFARHAHRGLFAFAVAHTVHFAMVTTLTVATGGDNVEARGGWIAVSSVGALFYVGVFVLWRGHRLDAASNRIGGRPGGFRVLVLTLIWAGFAQAYLLRTGQSIVFALIAAALSACYAAFVLSLVQGRRRHAGEPG